jgi:hypothetical protein
MKREPHCGTCRYSIRKADPVFRFVDPGQAYGEWSAESVSDYAGSTDTGRPYPDAKRFVGGACLTDAEKTAMCQPRHVAQDVRPRASECNNDARRFSTIVALASASTAAGASGGRAVAAERNKNFYITITPEMVADFMLDGGLLAITWAGLALGIGNLSEAFDAIMGNGYRRFRNACERLSDYAGEIIIFKNMGPTPGKLAATGATPPLAVVVASYYDFRRHGYYVNFAAEHLGGGVANPIYMTDDAKGWAMEETIAFQSNQMPLLYETKSSDTAAPYSNLLLGLDVCPVILRVKQLFHLRNTFLGVGGKKKLIENYLRGVFTSRPTPHMHIYWICMASPDFSKPSDFSGGAVAAVTQMYHTALAAFTQCFFRWKSAYLFQVSEGHKPSEKLEVNTGAWGAGHFGMNLEVSITAQYLAALAVRKAYDSAPIQLVFNLGPGGAPRTALRLLADLRRLKPSARREKEKLAALAAVQSMGRTGSVGVDGRGNLIARSAAATSSPIPTSETTSTTRPSP